MQRTMYAVYWEHKGNKLWCQMQEMLAPDFNSAVLFPDKQIASWCIEFQESMWIGSNSKAIIMPVQVTIHN